jgi:hypothetical protein
VSRDGMADSAPATSHTAESALDPSGSTRGGASPMPASCAPGAVSEEGREPSLGIEHPRGIPPCRCGSTRLV